MALLRVLIASIGMTVVLVACGSPAPPTPTTLPIGNTPLGCFEVDPIRCDRALAIALERSEGATPSYVQAAWSLCDGPCPGQERGVWRAHVTIEFSDGRRPITAQLSVDGDAVSWEVIETVMLPVTPRSGPGNPAAVELELGHCGLASGIDVDGSYWDPVGPVDAEHPDAINAAPAIFTPIGPNSATLRTRGGLVVELVRHVGRKHLPGCD